MTTDRSTPSRPADRILVRGVNWLGDAVMTTPALLRLREARPDAHIALLTHEKLAGLWQGHEALNAVLTFASSEGVWKIARRLREGRFELGLVFPNSFRAALECWLAGIPQRCGMKGSGRWPLLTQAVPPREGAITMRKRSRAEIQRLAGGERKASAGAVPAGAHHIHQYLHLAAALGANPAPLDPRIDVHEDEVSAVLAKFGLAPHTPVEPLLGLNPGAEYGSAKRWPRERFIAAAAEIHQHTRCRWIIFGGRGDVELAGEISAGLQVKLAQSAASPRARSPRLWNLAGQTSLRELCALLKGCGVLLTNDTGPMHVAAAVGTPVVVPFGSTSPELTGPGLPGDSKHRLLRAGVACAPCFLRECPIDFRCMQGIEVGQVVEAVQDCLAREQQAQAR